MPGNRMITTIKIRQVELGDEAELVQLFRAIYQESNFLLFEPGELNISVEEQAQLIEDQMGSESRVLFVADNGEGLIGFLGGTGGQANRNRHSIHIAMGVLEEYQGKGIGRQLLQTFINWASSNMFHRIELTVIEVNIKAKLLYESFGFKIEGKKVNSLKVNGEYINEYYMAKII